MNEAMELLDAAAGGPSGLEFFLRTHRLTPELATGVGDVLDSLLNAGRLGEAEFVASVLATLWLRLGDPTEALRRHIDYLQVRLMRAETAESYAKVRTDALGALGKAEEIKAAELAFRAAILAAESSYFGQEAGGNRLGLRVPVMLHDLVAGARYAHGAPGSTWFPKFVSLFGAVVNAAMSELLLDDERGEASQSLRRLAVEAEQLIPADYAFPDDLNKTALLASILTRLADEYRQ